MKNKLELKSERYSKVAIVYMKLTFVNVFVAAVCSLFANIDWVQNVGMVAFILILLFVSLGMVYAKSSSKIKDKMYE